MRVAFMHKSDPFLSKGLLNLDGRAVIDATSRFKAYQRVLADARLFLEVDKTPPQRGAGNSGVNRLKQLLDLWYLKLVYR